MERIVIVGAGLHAECVIAHILEENNFRIAGLLDAKKTGKLMGLSILGKDDLLDSLREQGIRYAFSGAVLGAKADTSVGRRIFEKISAAGFEIPNLVSSRAVIRQGVKLAKGVLVQPLALVDVATSLGNNVVVNPHVLIGHHCKVEDYAVFAGGSVTNASITIGKGAFIGLGAKIFADIGANSKVAPGAVVMEPVPDNYIAFGNPARIMPRME